MSLELSWKMEGPRHLISRASRLSRASRRKSDQARAPWVWRATTSQNARRDRCRICSDATRRDSVLVRWNEVLHPARHRLARVSVLRGDGPKQGVHIIIYTPAKLFDRIFVDFSDLDPGPHTSPYTLTPLKVVYKRLINRSGIRLYRTRPFEGLQGIQ
ncbi:hypothetical protein BJY52DRAFT_543546 [Lactarius psammicola]|nr:hypothetical protein BJY52DRAFT_543546 [Lactarius psammicola]